MMDERIGVLRKSYMDMMKISEKKFIAESVRRLAVRLATAEYLTACQIKHLTTGGFTNYYKRG